MIPLPRPGSTGRARRLVLLLELALVLTGCAGGTGTEAGTPTPTETGTGGVAAGSGTEPVGAGTYVTLGVDATPEIVTSTCVASTSARSTVVAAGDAGTEIAVTVFTTDPGPTVEVDVLTADGARLIAEDVAPASWRFAGSRIVGTTSLVGDDGDVPVEFAVDFSEELPDCDNQERLGPGQESPTPDVITT